jgi:hypothetical protein
VYNNVIYDVNLTSGNFTAIEVRTGGTAPEISFNTISLDNVNSTTGDLFGIKEELTNTNSILRNNIISITQPTTGISSALVLATNSTPASALNSDYNDLWVPSGNAAMKDANPPVLYTSLSNWMSVSGQDSNSVSADPLFISSVNPIPVSGQVDNNGQTIAYIPEDVTGALRSIPPDMGAYEFISTGVATNRQEVKFNVYPVPATERIHIRREGNSPADIKLYSAGGQLIYKLTSKEDEISIDVNALPAGIYWVVILDDGEIFSRKITITSQAF